MLTNGKRHLFGFDNDIQTFHRDEEIKEKEKIVLNYANNNNKEIKLNHVNNIFILEIKLPIYVNSDFYEIANKF